MKLNQGSGTSMVEDYPLRKHSFTKETENTPFLYNTFLKEARKVLKIDAATNRILKIYKSITEAADSVNICRTGIQNCLKNEQKTAGGFKWEYLK